jgi:sulfhydrogenase subunit delta
VSDARPRLAVFKFASCDGCQVAILNLDAALLELAERFEITCFLEVSSRIGEERWDVALIEGSITTADDARRIREIRERTRTLVAIGACATSGGIQALRNAADIEEWKRHVYPHPEWIHVLPTSTPIADHVSVDVQIEGCPVSREQVLRVLTRALLGARPDLPGASVCLECKRRGHACVLVSRGAPCLGPITRAGCGALCPSLGRDCYGCFGPCEDANVDALAARLIELGHERRDVIRRLRGVTGWRVPLRDAAQRLDAAQRVERALPVETALHSQTETPDE